MLVLSRKRSERILIGDEIAVTIVRIGPNTVRVGIEAPPHVNIAREELLLRTTDHGPRTEDEDCSGCVALSHVQPGGVT